jgi:hypothetical protein
VIDRVPDLMAGGPCLAAVRLNPNGGRLTVRGVTPDGEWTESIDYPACPSSAGSRSIPRLYAREQAERIELAIAGGARLDDELERIGLEYQISTRRTSWIAVSEEATVDPGEPTRRVKIAQSLPAGLSAEGLGLVERDYGMVHCAPPADMPRLIHDVQHGRGDAEIHFDLSTPRRVFKRQVATPIRLPARLVSLDEGRAIIEIELPDELDWRPKRVSIQDAAGATISRQGTTSAGRYEAGQIIRLVINRLPKRVTMELLHEVEVSMGPYSSPLILEITLA